MNKGIALYVHIPFCKAKCMYCDFPSFCGKESQMVAYAEALSKELDKINRRIKTIFIGGGTPTYLSLEGWNIIKESIDRLHKSENLEFSIEGNPGTFTEKKLRIFKAMGVNRLSIGLQAWQDKHLLGLGRIHSREEFVHSFKLARDLDFENINIDLMFGIPNQSFEEWKETLEETTKLNPEHLSCYSLIVEEGTPFYRLYEEDKLKLPGEELERKMYEYTIEFLNSKGYYQYEISNFAKENRECAHNLVYWNLGEYLGCGSSAHSYIDGYRIRNEESIDDYIKAINSDKSPIVEKKKNSLKDDMEEFMFMGLRKTKGIFIDGFKERFNTSIFNIYKDVINKYKRDGFIVEDGNRMYLSPKGIEISNVIMSDFLLD